MRIIDLLNKIAKGEEVPKKIKYNEDIYIHVDNYCYFCEETNKILSQNIYAEFSRLNDEVEIIEEEKDIKEIEVENGDIVDYDETGKHYIRTNRKDRNIYINKINELVREVRKLKNK